MHDLLLAGGKLVGLLFDFELSEDGPPFGGDEAHYRKLFEPVFKRFSIEKAHNSIEPRQGKEFFFIAEK